MKEKPLHGIVRRNKGHSRRGDRKADEDQKGLRQTLRTEVAVGGRGPDGQLSPTMKRGRMAVDFAELPELLQNRRTGR